MADLQHVNSFEELIVYRKARALQRLIYRRTPCFPREEMYSLTDQIRRSCRSVGGHISEAWAKRRCIRHFQSKITDGIGELYKILHWVITASDCEYIDANEEANFRAEIDEIGRMMNSMYNKADQFCITDSDKVREIEAEYLVDTEADNLPDDSS